MGESAAFELLHPKIQRWIWEQRWAELRDAQERAAPLILAGDRDVIVAASTASGKTEAAFLPICSALLNEADDASETDAISADVASGDDPPSAGLRALYVSPLKALINDQYGRLDALCEHLDLPVHRWHGDVDRSGKAKFLKAPSGILLITPESLEALFVVHGPQVRRLFGGLRHIVIDEMHTFIGTERGAQLRSLLHRIDLAARRRVPRIGLSATLGDMPAAATWLRPGRGDQVAIVIAQDGAAELRLQLRGHTTAPGHRFVVRTSTGDDDDAATASERAIADHLYRNLRGTDNLVFANSRRMVEAMTDALTRRSEADRVPNEFVPHHGSLAKSLREHVEARLKDRGTPVTAVCTSTLEMGIDIGSVESVAQLGTPPSVSALRQRLGRSGRRGGAAQTLRVYVTEEQIDANSDLADRLRTELVQAIAMVDLLLDRWYEPPDSGGLQLSTLIQQLLSLIAQHGGISPKDAHTVLCVGGPFPDITPTMFAALLRCLGDPDRDVITQTAEGLLLLGVQGELMVNHYSFFAAFNAPEEYRLIADGRELGTLPVSQALTVGSLVVFAGRRWKVVDISAAERVIELTASSGGRPPKFDAADMIVHDQVRRRMLARYTSADDPAYLDPAARRLLAEGRAAFARHYLATTPFVPDGTTTHLLLWRGDRILTTLALALTAHGLETLHQGPILTALADPPTTTAALRDLASQPPPDPHKLAEQILNPLADKWDTLLDPPLLLAACASRTLDVPAAWEELHRLTAHLDELP